jgi:hypothetical protein
MYIAVAVHCELLVARACFLEKQRCAAVPKRRFDVILGLFLHPLAHPWQMNSLCAPWHAPCTLLTCVAATEPSMVRAGCSHECFGSGRRAGVRAVVALAGDVSSVWAAAAAAHRQVMPVCIK